MVLNQNWIAMLISVVRQVSQENLDIGCSFILTR